jgi:hypothetical protein
VGGEAGSGSGPGSSAGADSGAGASSEDRTGSCSREDGREGGDGGDDDGVLSTPKAVRPLRTTADEAVRTVERKRKAAAVMMVMAI